MTSTKKMEVLIGGFTLLNETLIASLHLGIKDGFGIVYAGTSCVGFESDEHQHKLMSLLKPLLIYTCPFNTYKASNTAVHWVKPILVCEVSTGNVSQLPLVNPEFLWLREDKNISKHLHKTGD